MKICVSRTIKEWFDFLFRSCWSPYILISVCRKSAKKNYLTIFLCFIRSLWSITMHCMYISTFLLNHICSLSPSQLVRTPPAHKGDSTSEVLQSRKDLFAYVLTLLRGQFQEHGGVLPAVDMGGMEHLAWCFDALFYLLQHSRSPPPPSHAQTTPVSGFTSHPSQLRFFRRSDSVVCLGTVPLSPFDPLAEALPLAEKPQLLDGTQDKEMLFGYQMSTLLQDWPNCSLPDSPLKSLLDLYPGGPGRTWPRQPPPSASSSSSGAPLLSISLSQDETCGWDSHKLTASVLVGRWGGCLEVFSQAFMDSVGKQKDSVLSQEQHFKHREKEFRKEMDCMRATCHREIVMEVWE